jgi:amino-acid N-acetyltransferase
MNAAIVPARANDLRAVQTLLQACALPFSDLIIGNCQDCLVVRDGGRVMACVAIERYGQEALLRSLAVHDSARGAGWARKLVTAIEAHAAVRGIRSAYLLTTTASSFFAQLGCREIGRTDAPQVLQSSTQFAGVCPANATCMVKRINTAPKDNA